MPHNSPPQTHDCDADLRLNGSRLGPVPKLEFPKFDGENPRLWKDCCEMYFEVSHVSESLKTRFAALNFSGPAAAWLQTLELRGRVTSWETLCSAVCERFDKNQYSTYMRQLDLLRQTGSVSEYYAAFEQLSHQILLYNNSYDDVFFVNRFLYGLKDDIRAPITLHRPKNVDTASALALLQEQELENAKKLSPKTDTSRAGSRVFTATDKSKPGFHKADKQVVDDKWAAIKAYRKANGLCYVCGEKWGHGHKCPQTVPIHVVQEIMELFLLDDEADPDTPRIEQDEEDEVILSVQNTTLESSNPKKRRTLRFKGSVGQQDVLILLDSGSVGTFISQTLAGSIDQHQTPCESIQFYTADGTPMVSDKMIDNLSWFIQGHSFTFDARILPLKHYDIIMGADWLEEHSPTWIHWKKKIMRFPHMGRRIQLLGLKEDNKPCTQIAPHKLKSLIKRNAIVHCLEVHAELQSPADSSLCSVTTDECTWPEMPSPVHDVVQKFHHLFQEPTTLPPARDYDHHIPIIPGAQPVNIRPYRYSPQQKTEIENQVATMLKNGVIAHSTSPFASPVLLVKKKDGTWRFCIDFRHLNAITVKNKHPLPIVDELLDELAGACWFTKLDFRAGYHQIRVCSGDEFKTAFRTHHGLYEFKVMPFSLTNAPATFQSIMNQIFAPLLRKHVLVFMDDILIYSKTLSDHVQHLEQVFKILEQHQFFVKLSKCEFAKQELEYLGHTISAQGVSTEPTKI